MELNSPTRSLTHSCTGRRSEIDRLTVNAGRRLPVVNAVLVPTDVDEAAVRKRLLSDYDIEVAGGLGPVAGKIWRIGLMGESATRDNVATLLGGLETILGRGGALPASEAAYQAG